METLRRAALYASADAEVATVSTQFGDRLVRHRSPVAPTISRCRLRLSDRDYRQIAELDTGINDSAGAPRAARAIGSTDGYALIKKTLDSLDGPAMEFAAALMTGRRRWRVPRPCAAAARCRTDVLLARNLGHLHNRLRRLRARAPEDKRFHHPLWRSDSAPTAGDENASIARAAPTS